MEEGGGSGYLADFLKMSTIDVDDGVNGGGGHAAALLTMSTIDVEDGVDGGGGCAAALLTMQTIDVDNGVNKDLCCFQFEIEAIFQCHLSTDVSFNQKDYYFLCEINNDVAKKTTMELVIVLQLEQYVRFYLQEKQMVIESASLEYVTMELILTWQGWWLFQVHQFTYAGFGTYVSRHMVISLKFSCMHF